MTDVTIREIRDLRELTEPPAARPEPDPGKEQEKAAREAALADAFALIEKNRQLLGH
jgi:hypothetical protein